MPGSSIPFWQQCLVVGGGGFLGAIARFALSREVVRVAGERFAHAGTLAVNVVGCLLIGWCLVWVEEHQPPAWMKGLAVTGFLGSLTTFSTFGYETVELLRESRTADALWNVSTNLAVGLAAVVAGGWLANRFV